MKFAYIDESGSPGSTKKGVFTMAGILVDADELQQLVADFGELLNSMLGRLPQKPSSNELPEIKSSSFIRGKDEWQNVPTRERRQFFRGFCKKVAQAGTVCAYGVSRASFGTYFEKATPKLPFRQDHIWVASAMFMTCLIQKTMQDLGKASGPSVIVFDEHSLKRRVSAKIQQLEPWYDGLYSTKQGNTWALPEARFSRILKSGFSANSESSSMIQAADILAHIYRRYLELAQGWKESFDGEKRYYSDLVATLEPKRTQLGLRQKTSPVVKFYRQVKHPHWKL